jgi:hypothetical protein
LLSNVQRIILKAKPAIDNLRYNEWETASVIFFVDEPDKNKALEVVKNKLHDMKWEILYYELKDTLVEERVQEAENIIKEAYAIAKSKKIYYNFIYDNFGPGKNKSNYLCPPKINEQFIEKVIIDAGGRRLTESEKANSEELNADFIIGDFVIELKSLMEEGFDKDERRKKISNLFSKYYSTSEPIFIDPTILDSSDQRLYTSILSSPVEKKISKAHKQVIETRKRISPNLKIGLIYLNSGYLSFPHDSFNSEVNRYINKNCHHFDDIITLSISAQTNGFDLYVEFFSDPQKSSNKETKMILDSWNKNAEEIMTKLVRGEIKDLAKPQKPVSFSDSGIDFYWLPYAIERFTF